MQVSLAPLAEYTDYPFRRACRAFGLRNAYTPMIDAGALAHGSPGNDVILARGDDEPWLGVQLLGGWNKDLPVAARMLLDMPYDAYDFNMGCPMQKVIKRPAGAALTWPENQGDALACVEMLRKIWTGRIFTVKMRILDFENPEPTVQFARRLEECGVDGLTVHGRVQKAIYSGEVSTRVIAAVREAVSIPVTANGGVFDKASAERLSAETGCERVMVARGAIGNPWIFRALLQGGEMRPTHGELCDVLERHIEGICELYPRPFPVARKIVVSYVRGRGYSKRFRERGCRLNSWEEFWEFARDLRAEGPVGRPGAG